jgi:hypothetical protein
MKTFLSLFKRKFKYRVILKSGASFTLKASDLNVSFKTDSMQLTEYEFTDRRNPIPLFAVGNFCNRQILIIYAWLHRR